MIDDLYKKKYDLYEKYNQSKRTSLDDFHYTISSLKGMLKQAVSMLEDISLTHGELPDMIAAKVVHIVGLEGDVPQVAIALRQIIQQYHDDYVKWCNEDTALNKEIYDAEQRYNEREYGAQQHENSDSSNSESEN